MAMLFTVICVYVWLATAVVRTQDTENLFKMVDNQVAHVYSNATTPANYIRFGRVNYCLQSISADVRVRESCQSCRARCGTGVSVQSVGQSHRTKFNFTCGCDHMCMLYNDCCEDFSTECPAMQAGPWKGMSETREDIVFLTECESYTLEHTNRGEPISINIKMMTYCYYTGEKCDYSTFIVDDPNLFIPVLDNDTGIHYPSVQCAKCNGVTNSVPWKHTIDCWNRDAQSGDVRQPPINVTNYKDPKMRMAAQTQVHERSAHAKENKTIESKDAFKEILGKSQCEIKFTAPNIGPTRHCVSDVVSSCPDLCVNEELKQKCRYGREVPTTDGTINFKNYYCGLCNMHYTELLSCGQYQDLHRYARMPNLGSFSLSLLLSFDLTSGGFNIGHTTREHDGDMITSANKRSSGVLNDTAVGSPLWYSSLYLTLYVILMVPQGQNAGFWDTVNYKNMVFNTYVVHNRSDVSSEIWLTFHSEKRNKMKDGTTEWELVYDVEMMLSHNITDSQLTSYMVSTDEYVKHKLKQNIEIDHCKLFWNITGKLNSTFLEQNKCEWEELNVNKYVIDLNKIPLFSINGSSLLLCKQPVNDSFNVKSKDTVRAAWEGILTIILVSLSMVCLAIRIVMQCCVKRYQTFSAKLHVNCALALFFANASLLTAPFLQDIPLACSIIAGVKYTMYLSSFCWVNGIAFDTYRVLSYSTKHLMSTDDMKYSLVGFIIYGWILPFSCGTALLVLDMIEYQPPIPDRFKPNFVQNYCWFSDDFGSHLSLFCYFYAPVALSVFANLVFFVLIVNILCKMFSKSNAILNKSESCSQFLIFTKIFAILGISWVLLLVAAFIQNHVLLLIAIVANASQGFLFFVAYTCNKQTFDCIKPAFTSTSDTSTKTKESNVDSKCEFHYENKYQFT